MARKRSLNLTEAEQRLMEVLWEKGPASVAEVADALPKKLGLAYNTVLTTLRIMEEKGYVRHTSPKDSRKFVYSAVVTRQQASHSALRNLMSRFFGNSAEALVLNLLEDEKLSEEELERIRNLLKESGPKEEDQ
ncbi:MAG TPA: BlaI/MecI/CopY family transcriptional regulator [Bryobacteraceae bacterium]|nr:BlaI/MecI/CopY family transcriptional regulator [Bryobacteraceae bacterium]